MFDFNLMEMAVVAVVALVVVGPKELPGLLRTLGKGRRQMMDLAGQFRSGFDQMMREAELDELRSKVDTPYTPPVAYNPPPAAYDSAAEPLPTETTATPFQPVAGPVGDSTATPYGPPPAGSARPADSQAA